MLVTLLCVVGAHAITVGTPTTTLNDIQTDATNVTYTFAGYSTPANQLCTGVELTFPADTDVSGATAASYAGTVTVAGQVVTYTFATPIPRSTAISVAIGGITNPSVPVTQTAGNITFFLTKTNGQPLASEVHPTGSYSVVAPTFEITIDRASIDFIDLYPEIPSATESVNIGVNSSRPFTVTRDVGADWSAIGLEWVDGSVGSHLAGVHAFADDFTATPPWEMTPETTYTVDILYTFEQQIP